MYVCVHVCMYLFAFLDILVVSSLGLFKFPFKKDSDYLTGVDFMQNCERRAYILQRGGLSNKGLFLF